MTRIAALLVALSLLRSLSFADAEPPVRITLKPSGLVHGFLTVPVSADPNVTRIELTINSVKFSEQAGRSVVFRVPVGNYLRRLRIAATGYDAEGNVVGMDEMSVNDPQPPFRLRLFVPAELPESGVAQMTATVTAPSNLQIEGVDFYVGEELIGTDVTPPWAVWFDVGRFEEFVYARATVRARGNLHASDVFFWGAEALRESIEVNLHHLPVSVAGAEEAALTAADLVLRDNGEPKAIESVIRAADQPLNVILLVDSSQSMLDELPLVKQAASDFARSVIRKNDRIAVVAFRERRLWLTPFTSDMNAVDRAVEKLQPMGQTHLYDAAIEMLFHLQKMPGRRALVVLTDGVNQGGTFNLDQLVHYARYAGVPIYPIVRNAWLARTRRLGLSLFEAKRFANIARDSGATYFIIRRPSELPSVYRQISNELKQQYLLAFYTRTDATDAWHTISLETTRRGLRLRAPRGYFP